MFMLLEHQYTYCWSSSSNHHNNNSTTISNPVSEYVGRVVPASLWVLLRWHFVTTICCMMQPHITIDSGKWFIRFLKTCVHIQICACVNFRTHCVLIEYDPLLNRGRGHWHERSDITSYIYSGWLGIWNWTYRACATIMCIGPHIDNHCRNYGKNSFAQLYLACIVSFIIDECMVKWPYQCFQGWQSKEK